MPREDAWIRLGNKAGTQGGLRLAHLSLPLQSRLPWLPSGACVLTHGNCSSSLGPVASRLLRKQVFSLGHKLFVSI